MIRVYNGKQTYPERIFSPAPTQEDIVADISARRSPFVTLSNPEFALRSSH
jgi:hypothetical protein